MALSRPRTSAHRALRKTANLVAGFGMRPLVRASISSENMTEPVQGEDMCCISIVSTLHPSMIYPVRRMRIFARASRTPSFAGKARLSRSRRNASGGSGGPCPFQIRGLRRRHCRHRKRVPEARICATARQFGSAPDEIGSGQGPDGCAADKAKTRGGAPPRGSAVAALEVTAGICPHGCESGRPHWWTSA